MSTSWTSDEKTLLESVRATLSTKEIQQLFKVLGRERTIDAIQKQSKKLGITFKDYGDPGEYGFTKEEVKAIKQVLSAREGWIIAIEPPSVESPSIKGIITTQKRNALSNITEELKNIRKETPRKSSLSTKVISDIEGKESLVLLLSDWHMGQIVKDPETGQIVYDMSIAQDRVEMLPALLSANLGAEKMGSFDECVVILAGDIVTGEGIFPHQEMSLEDHAVAQTLAATKSIWFLLKRLRGMFPMVRVITTKGNHGRTMHSPEANWDNVIYQELELLIDLEGDENLTIKNRYGDFATAEVKGWKGLIRHQAPAQAESAFGAIKFAGWYGIHEWDFFCFGHFHHWGVTTWTAKPIYRNGALVGGDEYAEGLAKYDNPVQICFGVSPGNPCTFVTPLTFKE